jgi:hypothetical protein
MHFYSKWSISRLPLGIHGWNTKPNPISLGSPNPKTVGVKLNPNLNLLDPKSTEPRPKIGSLPSLILEAQVLISIPWVLHALNRPLDLLSSNTTNATSFVCLEFFESLFSELPLTIMFCKVWPWSSRFAWVNPLGLVPEPPLDLKSRAEYYT